MKLIDAGGAYRFKNPVFAASEPPNFNLDEAQWIYNFDLELLRDSYRATTHPEFIRNIAEAFVREKFGDDNFVSIHFRFNQDDFFSPKLFERMPENINDWTGADDENLIKGLRRLDISVAKPLFLSLRDPSYFIERLMKFLDRSSQEGARINKNTTIYIASPTNLAERFEKAADKHRDSNKDSHRLLTSIEVKAFLQSYRKSCWVVDTYFGDVLSTLEKEIIVMSRIFYRARPSNWSFNVQGHRMARYEYDYVKYDRVLFDIFKD